MRSPAYHFILALCGLLSVNADDLSNNSTGNVTLEDARDISPSNITVQGNSTIHGNLTEVTFEDVRENLPKNYSGLGGEPGPKYFKTLPHLSALIQTYLSTMADLGAETWIMHGSLLAWWWNQKISEPTIHFLADYYNMTEHHFDLEGVEGGRTYLLEINPQYVVRSKMDKANVIDGRWIDTSSGLFIDITAVRADDAGRANGKPGALMCKDRHNFDEADIYPLRISYFEDVPARIPYAYTKLLQDEYGPKALSNKNYQGYSVLERYLSIVMSIPPLDPATAARNYPPTSSSFALGDANSDDPSPATHSHVLQDSLAHRSCITCRRRKVRCNKRSPCSNCTKAGIECIFPPPGRAPRKVKRPQAENTELLSRLRQLESIVEAAITNPNNAQTQSTQSPPQQHRDNSTDEPTQPPQNEVHVGCPKMAGAKQTPALEHEFGRLVIEDNRSRYIEELQDILDPSSSDEDDEPSPRSLSGYSTTHEGMVFGFYSLAHSLQNFHPPPGKVPVLWNIYAENVQPLLPIVYKPTAQQLFTSAPRTPDTLDKNNEALVLAMYFTAIISMSADQCLNWLGEARETLVTRYRFAVEQALSRAGLMNTQSLTLMQAAVIFLNAVRREDDTKFVWSMSALILRLAQGLGLHRDGNNFGLKPFEAEMRRRLWWHVVLLDSRSSEDHGTDALIHDRMFDTRLPLNVNDSDISPDMSEPPKPRVGFTDMSFFLIRTDICFALRRVEYSCPTPNNAGPGHSPDKCSNVVQAVNKHVEEQYLKYIDMADPIQWISATVARLVLTKMWLVINHPMTRSDNNSKITQESRESLFITSIEVTEFARLIKEDQNTRRWSWMFDAHMQWHAIAMVLSELCVRPLSPLTNRAWLAVTTVYDDWLLTAKQRKGMLWRPLAKLMRRAEALRKSQLAELTANMEDQHATSQRLFSASTNFQRPSVGLPFSSHFPEHTRLVGESPPMGFSFQNPLDFDIGQGPMGVINQIFPEAGIFAAPEPHSSIPSGASVNPTLTVPSDQSPGNSQGSSDPGPNYQEWDQVLRDFQMEMQGANDVFAGDITNWLA
ncbi:fungal-specific transcription factor domain-containing protein [Aspergillus karnatakaensis]|uniref:putative C6 transcription factor n=1 Tax=Aspergillus karnatakaensis TaxID=1810916 RepID=UPI003CCCD731